ncbi:ATP-binding protein [Chitinophaga sedimenti]|nr:ATP-binding protein [Chitinophaga sedimenti]
MQIKVVDLGIGVPADMKDKIFDMFTISRRPGTAGEQSFGLGLSISRQIIEAHGGTIWCESSPGNGSTFLWSCRRRPYNTVNPRYRLKSSFKFSAAFRAHLPEARSFK